MHENDFITLHKTLINFRVTLERFQKNRELSGFGKKKYTGKSLRLLCQVGGPNKPRVLVEVDWDCAKGEKQREQKHSTKGSVCSWKQTGSLKNLGSG